MKNFRVVIPSIILGILLGVFFTYHFQEEKSAEYALYNIYHHSYVQARKSQELLSALDENNYEKASKKVKNMLYSSNAVLEECFENLCNKEKYSDLNNRIIKAVAVNREWLNNNTNK